MRDTRKLGKAIFIACLMIVSSIVPLSLLSTPVTAYVYYHDPISINGDADFAAQAAAASEPAWPGSGTLSDPYIIPQLYIDTTAVTGISIKNTKVHFIISECLIGWNMQYVNNGIYLENVQNCTIDHVWSCYSQNGIFIKNCKNIKIQGGDFDPWAYGLPDCSINLRMGIYVTGSRNVTIADMHNEYQQYGLYVSLSSLINIIGGDYVFNQEGIYVASCSGVEIRGITTINSWYLSPGNLYHGIDVRFSKNVNITDVIASNNGFNGIYLASDTNVRVMGTKEVPSTLQCKYNTYNGIYAYKCVNLRIDGGEYSNGDRDGLSIQSCTTPTLLYDIYASNNAWNGVDVVLSPGAIITEGAMEGNGWNGIYAKSSNGVKLDNVTADHNNGYGIYLSFSNNALVTNGTSASKNYMDGIYTGSCRTPTVEDTVSNGNSYYGIRTLACTLVTITGCDLSGNSYGETYWPNAAPSAIFTFNGHNPKRIDTVDSVVDGKVVLDASASSDFDGSIVSYHWEFGDGTTLNGWYPIVNHHYDMGNYVINLTTRDNEGKYSLKSIVTIAIQANLLAKIVMPDSAIVDEVVQLDGSRSYSFDGMAITQYLWDFGDSTTGSGVNPTHQWTTPGTYVVKLRVKDSLNRYGPNMTGRILISPSGISALSVEAERHSLFPGETTNLHIKAVDASGTLVSSGAEVQVDANRGSYGWTGLPITTNLVGGEITIPVKCAKTYAYNITAYLTGTPSVIGYEHVTIANRTVEMTVYDFMQYPFGADFGKNEWNNYWNFSYRGKYGDCVFRWEYPCLNYYATSGTNLLTSNIDTNYRLHVEARNLTDLSMADPIFFPRLNTGPGGNVSFTWDYHYMNCSEFYGYNLQQSPDPRLPSYGYSWNQFDKVNWARTDPFSYYSQSISGYDGWETWMHIHVTMDEDAAYQMINMPRFNFTDDPIKWWNWIDWDLYKSKNYTVRDAWDAFWIYEGGDSDFQGRLDVKSCDDGYAWAMGLYGEQFNLSSNGMSGKDRRITLEVNQIGYGAEVLLARWLYWGGVSTGWNWPNATRYGIVPFEPYYDDFHMSGEFNDKTGNLTLDTGVIYGFRAQKSKDPNIAPDTAAWRWEQIMVDYMEDGGTPFWSKSEMNLWSKNWTYGVGFEVWDPAGTAWGTYIQADQSPNVIRLGLGQSIVMQKPRTVVTGIMPQPLVGNAGIPSSRTLSGYNNWVLILEKYGNATIHPLGCVPGTSVVDKGTGDLDMVGGIMEPIVQYYSADIKIDDYHDFTWLWTESAPLIEYWIA